MTDQDRPQFAAVLAQVAEVFGESVSTGRAEAYFSALSELEIAEVRAAAAALIRSCRFFPKPAEWLEVLQGSPEDHAERAWSNVLTAIRKVGGWETVHFQDPATDAVVRTMWRTWEEACDVLSEELGYRHAEFLKIYRAARRNAKPSQPWPGRLEIDNRARGFLQHVPRPVLIAPDGRRGRDLPQLERPASAPALPEHAGASERPRRLRAVRSTDSKSEPRPA